MSTAEQIEWLYVNGWEPATLRRKVSCSEFKLRNYRTADFTRKEEREIAQVWSQEQPR